MYQLRHSGPFSTLTPIWTSNSAFIRGMEGRGMAVVPHSIVTERQKGKHCQVSPTPYQVRQQGERCVLLVRWKRKITRPLPSTTVPSMYSKSQKWIQTEPMTVVLRPVRTYGVIFSQETTYTTPCPSSSKKNKTVTNMASKWTYGFVLTFRSGSACMRPSSTDKTQRSLPLGEGWPMYPLDLTCHLVENWDWLKSILAFISPSLGQVRSIPSPLSQNAGLGVCESLVWHYHLSLSFCLSLGQDSNG